MELFNIKVTQLDVSVQGPEETNIHHNSRVLVCFCH